MEEKYLKDYKESLGLYTIKHRCKRLNLFWCDITRKNLKEKINYVIKYEQQKLKKDLKKYKIKLGFIHCFNNKKNYLNFTNQITYIIDIDDLYQLENDIEVENYNTIVTSFINIDEYNQFHKKLNKVNDKKVKLINIHKFNKLSQLIKHKNLMKNQYSALEKYFNNHQFPNQFTNNIVEGFVHNLNYMKLEILLKSGNGKFFNPVSQNTYDSERGIYTTLQTSKCHVSRFIGINPALIFSKQLANDFGYIFNFMFQYGRLTKNSYIKGQTFKIKGKEYSAVEKGTLEVCKKEENERSHEVIFYTDHIKLKDYLEAIIFTDEEMYKLFKNMKGIKFKNKFKLK